MISETAPFKNLRIVLPALVLGLVLSAASFYLNRPDALYLEVRMSSSVASIAQVFFNMGRGENEQDSDHTTLAPSTVLRAYRFRVPPGETLQGLRFDALDGEGQVRIAASSVITSSGAVLQRFSPADFLPRYQFVKAGEDAVAATFVAARSPGQRWDPMLSIRLNQPIRAASASRARKILLALFVWLASSFLIGLLIAVGSPSLYFRLALYFTIVFQIIHLAGLPPFVSYDGMQYSYLARLLFTPSFYSSWDFQRTPLLPFLLRISFFLGGDQPVGAILPNILFGAGGILLLGSLVRHVAGKTYAAAALILLSCYPYIVGYQHIVLTEIGTFFMFALLLWSLLRISWSRNKTSYSFPAQIALVLALGYYQRPTFIYLAPLISVFYIFLVTAPVDGALSYATLRHSMRQRFRSILPRAAVILIVPWLLCLPWRVLAVDKTGNTANVVIGLGMTRQAMIPPDDPRLGSLGAEYGRVIKETMSDGRFHPDGLGVGAHFPMFLAMGELVGRIGPMAFIRDYPWGYVKGWFRTMIVYMGYPREPVDCENAMFSRALFTQWPADYTLEKTLGWEVKYDQFMPPVYTGGGALGQVLWLLIGPYSSLLLASTWISLLWLVLALRKPDPVAIAMAGVPLGFLAFHALTLFSASRYSFPTYPLFLANLICVGCRLEQPLRRFLQGRAQNRGV
jgi:4-amino-4-deoxy-L-arabinose transferase-like glycosyltransferase